MGNFDFDEWANLYKTDPVEFEHRRKNLLESLILTAPVSCRNKLRLLQMECDSYHDTLSPIDATVAITKLMLGRANELQYQLQSLKSSINTYNKLVDK